MADVSFNSSDHKLTESDVPQSEEGLQKSSQAVKELASGQTARDWTPEPAAQLLRTAIIHFFSTCDEAFTKEKATLHEFGTNVDLAIAEFARVNESRTVLPTRRSETSSEGDCCRRAPPPRLTGPTRRQPRQPKHPLVRMRRIRVRPTSANPRPAAPRSPASNVPLRFQAQGEVSWLAALNTSS